MRFRRHLKLEQGLKDIDIVPLINMIFLLVLFSMLTSGFVVQTGLKVNLPKALTSEAVKYENIEIVVSGDNVIYLNNQVVDLKELKTVFESISGRNAAVLIKADRRAALDKVVGIWDLCRQQGIIQVNIATDQ